MRLFQTRIIRLSSYSVALVLAVTMANAVLPPLAADESDRAVIDAPAILITAPIDGEVRQVSIKSGQSVASGEPVAQILNDRVEQTTLVSLEEKAASIRKHIQAAHQKREADLRYLATLDADISAQRDQLTKQMQGQLEETRARIAEFDAEARAKQAVLDHQKGMLARNVVSEDMVKPTQQQYDGAIHKRDAEQAKLRQKEAQLAAVRGGIFVGDGLNTTAAVVQKRKDLDLDAKQLEIEERELTTNLTDLEKLVLTEHSRVQMRREANIATPEKGEVLRVAATVGQHVHAGDTLARLVNCDESVIVAIFSYRQGQNLTAGTAVSVTGASFTQGRVEAVLPKTDDKLDERYAVPFPQTERRELYVLISPEPGANQASDTHAESKSSVCGVGHWVTVTRRNGWVPSTSGVWRRLRQVMLKPFFGSAAAEPQSKSTAPHA